MTEGIHSTNEIGLSATDQAAFGLSVRVVDGKTQAYYKADGTEHVVASADETNPGSITAGAIAKILQEQIVDIEKGYRVKVAAPGEKVQQPITITSDCKEEKGNQILAKTPTFPDVFATKKALAHSVPSQFVGDGSEGVKIYFLDKPILTQNVYGNKPALAMYKRSDKDGRPALFITPDAEKLPPTAKDTDNPSDPNNRNLAGVIVHELTHNSQRNVWAATYPYLPDKFPESMGWTTLNRIEKEGRVKFEAYQLNGKQGETYFNTALKCGDETAWYAIKGGHFIGSDGHVVSDQKDIKPFTNSQVSDNAVVKPPTYYFPNPTEMHSEGLTSYRTSAETRARLFRESPKLYEAVEKYDRTEIAKYYGTEYWSGQNKFLRSPEGTLVPRTSANVENLQKFELKLKSGH